MNRFIIADASKCIGCRTCEVACVVSHQANQDCARADAKIVFTAYPCHQGRQRVDGHRLSSV
ncbi:Electron transport protein hydN [Raoultella terrigena]|uniref:Electron transport protein hydN n=1 Tax=Raoultella terrigena TaxID=577 RepID=A0A3P8ISP8_RAOTE|nr:Electron transport protein hydN [Raoultella terrigena]